MSNSLSIESGRLQKLIPMALSRIRRVRGRTGTNFGQYTCWISNVRPFRTCECAASHGRSRTLTGTLVIYPVQDFATSTGMLGRYVLEGVIRATIAQPMLNKSFAQLVDRSSSAICTCTTSGPINAASACAAVSQLLRWILGESVSALAQCMSWCQLRMWNISSFWRLAMSRHYR